uniref:Uncharacterized protein n=1 Tax=Zea mays TaxID=4577 RepID=C0HJ72_MAIZE|nr:unknown [Zea mays]
MATTRRWRGAAARETAAASRRTAATTTTARPGPCHTNMLSAASTSTSR